MRSPLFSQAILYWQGRTFAMTEMGMPIEVDPETLETLGASDLDGAVDQGLNAHVPIDAHTGTIFAIGMTVGLHADFVIYALPVAGAASEVTRVRPREMRIIHDFAMSSIAERQLAGILRGPLPGASEGARSGVVIVQRDSGVQLTRRVGDTRSIADVAVIGVIRESTRRGPCGTYVDARTRARVDVGWTAIDAAVTVYERSTGRTLGTRSFASPTPRCASSIRSSPRSRYDDAMVEALVARSAPRG